MNQVATQQRASGFDVVQANLKSKETLGRLVLSLGLDNSKESINEARSYASSVLMEIERNLGDPKKDISNCTPNSIVQSMIDAARMRIYIDNRQHAHLVKYGNKATLQIGYRGYVHKLKEHFEDCDFHYGAIYEGDVFTVDSKDGFDHYTYKAADPFQDDESKLKGVYVAISFTVGGERKQKVTRLSVKEISKIKKTAKQHYIWDAWFIEKAIAAAIKRACKVHFSSIKELKDLADYDNQTHFKPLNDKEPEVSSKNPFETMNKIKQDEDKAEENEQASNIQDVEEVIEEDSEPPTDLFQEPVDTRKALFDALNAINNAEAYTQFLMEFEDVLNGLSEDDQATIKTKLEQIKKQYGIET